LKRIVLTVTTDLTYDQRMQRIGRSLASAGYAVTLIGRHLPLSVPLQTEPYRQHRMRCVFRKGKAFYLEYQCRLFLRLLRERMDVVCAVDLDTVLPCYAVSRLKGVTRVLDAHELFTEMKEVVTRPLVRSVWKAVERFAIPRFPRGYTVSGRIADHFRREYGVDYRVVRNLAVLQESISGRATGDYIIYQGAVNEGRCFEWLLPAMKEVDVPLHIYGDGNLLDWVGRRIVELGLEGKVVLMGKREPDALRPLTAFARVGVNLVEDLGLNNRYSLANRFFDYVHAGIPQVCSDLPAYRELNERFRVALTVDGRDPAQIADALNNLLRDAVLSFELSNACRTAARVWNWQEEEKTLLGFYGNL
jgi:glycosyltransferase involved in cell wall biosynthesis